MCDILLPTRVSYCTGPQIKGTRYDTTIKQIKAVCLRCGNVQADLTSRQFCRRSEEWPRSAGKPPHPQSESAAAQTVGLLSRTRPRIDTTTHHTQADRSNSVTTAQEVKYAAQLKSTNERRGSTCCNGRDLGHPYNRDAAREEYSAN